METVDNMAVFLACPVMGGGVPISRYCKMFLFAHSIGETSRENWATYAWNILQLSGEKLAVQDKALPSDEENIAELIKQAKRFEQSELPVLKALIVV